MVGLMSTTGIRGPPPWNARLSDICAGSWIMGKLEGHYRRRLCVPIWRFLKALKQAEIAGKTNNGTCLHFVSLWCVSRLGELAFGYQRSTSKCPMTLAKSYPCQACDYKAWCKARLCSLAKHLITGTLSNIRSPLRDKEDGCSRYGVCYLQKWIGVKVLNRV